MGDIKRQIGIGIPSNTENNSRREGKEHVKAIALRSSKVLSSPENPTQEMNKENTDDLQEEPLEADDEPELEEVRRKAKTDEDKFVSFLNLFKTLNVNLPLIEVIEKVPKYFKFLKEIMFRCRKIKVEEQVNISTSCSAIISRQIRSIHFNRALCDLGASINLMPLSICEELGYSVHLKGVLKDVLIKVRSFIISVDFLVLDFVEDREIPILLGRPFLATLGSTIDMENNELTMKINVETEVFKCGYQQSRENKRDSGEHCNELSTFNPNNPNQKAYLL
ncbi:bromodomain-containing protein [Gossypium australe]|uniref:Bromodomain-containing protein n=1 Tax=Gossypium australe TaxID=47621 RepID=A0A5B6WCZ5_9ROSI|nr:bromodomain-containing protein [Gossypium australe]